jgi:hypothetical protein
VDNQLCRSLCKADADTILLFKKVTGGDAVKEKETP